MNDPKPAKRLRATAAEWNDIRAAFVDDCCWSCGAVWADLHHILSRGAGRGDDVIPNLAALCRECHRRVEARDPVVRSLIRQALLPSHYRYLRSKLGYNLDGWIERHYPVVDASAYPRESRPRVEELTTTTTKELTTTKDLQERYITPAVIATDPANV